MTLNELANETYKVAKKRGFYPPHVAFKVLMCSMENESAEAEKAYMTGDYTGGKDSLDIELVDRVMVALSDCRHFNIDIDRIFKEKLEYNKRR